jgi:Retrotransposon gag protein
MDVFFNTLFQHIANANLGVPHLFVELQGNITQISGLALVMGIGAMMYYAAQSIIPVIQTLTTGVGPNVGQDMTRLTNAADTQMTLMAQTLVQMNERMDREKEIRDGKSKLELPKPKTYSGKPEDAEAFLITCKTYAQHKNETVSKAVVMFIIGLVNENDSTVTRNWATEMYRSIEETEKAGGEFPYLNYSKFKTEFKTYFCLLPLKEVAQGKLKQLKQGDSTCQHFTTLFNSYALASKFDDEYLLTAYKDGLNATLRTKVRSTYPPPDTLAKWKEVAVNLDQEFQKEKQENKERLANTRTIVRTIHAPAPTPAKDPNAMEIDAISSSNSSATPSGVCFACKKPGHRMDTCKNATCGNCGNKGHIWSNCPKPLHCRTCNQAGHAKSRCPQKPTYSKNVRATTTTATITDEQGF